MSNETTKRRYYKGYLVCESSSTGYPTIWINGKNTLIHRLVWEEANGEIPNGMQVHHKDHDKMNYSLDNLILLPIGEHHRHHALTHGLGKSNKGKPKKHQSGYCGLARKIKLMKGSTSLHFNSVSEAARYLGTQTNSVCRVATGKQKTIYGWEIEYA